MKKYLPLLFLIVAFVCGCQQSVELRFMTWNIHHGEGMDGTIDLERIARVIRNHDPDVVSLQEVDNKTRRSGTIDQAAILGVLTGMHVAFGKAMDFDGGQYGEAILSRYPFESVVNQPLPHSPEREPRTALTAVIDLTPFGQKLRFSATHFDHLPDDTDRVEQARFLLLPAADGDGTLPQMYPAILAGDLNAEPESEPMRILLAQWIDTASDSPAPTWPSVRSQERIDYILAAPPDRWRIIESRVIEETLASDHRPVLAVLDLLVQ